MKHEKVMKMRFPGSVSSSVGLVGFEFEIIVRVYRYYGNV